MLTGKFKLISPSSVIVDRDNRQRRDLDDLEELKVSIRNIGQINPITITKDYVLVAGERRLTAIRELGLDQVAVQFVEDLDETSYTLIELEENIKRTDLTWQDQCNAVTKFNNLQRSMNPEWTQAMTANALGLSPATVTRYLAVDQAVKANPELAKNARIDTVYNTIERQKARELDVLFMTEQATEEQKASRAEVPLVNADYFEWVESYSGQPFNLLHCDFPYGINFDKAKANNAVNKERYSDSLADFVALLESLPRAPVAESAHIIFWFSMRHYALSITKLREQGWTVDPIPYIWYKSDNKGILADPERGLRNIYETALIGHRGGRKLVRSTSNVAAVPRGEVMHSSTKSKDMLRKLLPAFVDHTTHMLDPTCGSGNAIAIGKELGAARVLGLERDPTFYADAVRAWEG